MNESVPNESRPVLETRRLAFTIARVGIAAAFLVLLFSRITIPQVLEVTERIDLRYVVAVLTNTLVMHCLLSYRLQLIAVSQGIEVSFFRTLAINFSAVFYSLFVPGGGVARGAVRIYKLHRESGQLNASTATIVFDRLIATAALGLVGQFFWIFDRPLTTIPIGMAFVALWIGPLAAHQTFRFQVLRTAIDHWLGLIGLKDLFRRGLMTLRHSLRSLEEMSLRWWSKILAASVLAHVLNCLSYYSLAIGLGIEVSFVQIAWISMATTLMAMLPISPSGLGVREGAVVFLLGQYGVTSAPALVLSLLAFICTVVAVGLVGGILEVGHWIRPGQSVQPADREETALNHSANVVAVAATTRRPAR